MGITKELNDKLEQAINTRYRADDGSYSSNLLDESDRGIAIGKIIRSENLSVSDLLILSNHENKTVSHVAKRTIVNGFADWLLSRTEIGDVSIEYDGDEDGAIYPVLSLSDSIDIDSKAEDEAYIFYRYHQLPESFERILQREGECALREAYISAGLEQESDEREEIEFRRAHAPGRV